MSARSIRSDRFYLGLVLLATMPLCFHLCNDRLIQSHDAMEGLIRAVCMDRYWGHGQFLVRWAPEVNFGYGSPMFDFYPPCFYYFCLVLSKMTHHIILSVNVTCVIFWLLSAAGIFLFAREFWGNAGGALSAVLYVYSPYYVQDFYVRGAFSEFSTFAVFPFLLLSVYKINQRICIRYILLGVLSSFVSTLTHGMSMFFVIISLFYALLLFFLNKKDRQAFFWSVFVLLTGLIMSAFYWLPAIWDTRFLHLNFIISMRYDFHKNFISLAQLFSVPWDHAKDMDGLSFSIGLAQICTLVLSFLVPLRIFKKDIRLAAHYFFFLIVGFAAILLTLPLSHVVWEHMNLLRFIQLPWRFLTIVVFAVSLLAGSSVLLFQKVNVRHLFFGLVVVFSIILPVRYYWFGNFTAIDQTALINGLSGFAFLGEGERTPKWIEAPPLAVPPQKFQVLQGQGQLSSYGSRSPIDQVVRVSAGGPLLVCFHTFYFPGWRVYIDDQETQIFPNNRYGLILFVVPQGEHALRAVFGLTPVRTAGLIISWMGIVLLLGGIWQVQRMYHKKK